jgi:ABC-type uncharacterized transport system permease subunit
MEKADQMRLPVLLLPFLCSGCAVVTVADAAVSVAATTVKATATVVGTAVDLTAAGVRAVIPKDQEEEEKKMQQEKK